ncbi:DUF488 family protein [Clostridium neuense]|uniref:DUF488 family protein n=1 Tax=Clostridium neuense TaxID=1728934 RepID=A0ABW8TIE3_9CLOT
MINLCYTIGHDNRKLKDFSDILKEYNINCIVDIRSVQSNITGDYNGENIKKFLNKLGIYYIPMEKEFDLSKQEFDRNDFEKVRLSEYFTNGIVRIENGIKKGFKIAVMGIEKEPIYCNRGIIVAYALKHRGINLKHIIDKETLKSQIDVEEELLKLYGVRLIKKVAELSIKSIKSNVDLDMDEKDFKNEMIEEAYRVRNAELNKKI